MNDGEAIRGILDFWLLPLSDPGYGKKREMWWDGTPELDAEIKAKFGGLLGQASVGALDHWANSPDGALALILLCDQFSRNIHRKSAKAFATDAKARAIARIALARFYPAAYPHDVRLFFYMPFEHSEDLADQELGCALFQALDTEDGDKHAREHRDIVAKYGRFPHRNEVLGRVSTADEIEYLKTANRFGQ
ncbi:MAG TPA: DUF924 family protein [Reyranella sp.]|nr:DUF924 family protein [Reyranella sp.]